MPTPVRGRVARNASPSDRSLWHVCRAPVVQDDSSPYLAHAQLGLTCDVQREWATRIELAFSAWEAPSSDVLGPAMLLKSPNKRDFAPMYTLLVAACCTNQVGFDLLHRGPLDPVCRGPYDRLKRDETRRNVSCPTPKSEKGQQNIYGPTWVLNVEVAVIEPCMA
jgi:hypothetical protein